LFNKFIGILLFNSDSEGGGGAGRSDGGAGRD